MDDQTSQQPTAGEPPPPVVPPPPNPASIPPTPPPAPAVVWASPSEPTGPAPGIEFAGYGSRLVAYIVDSIIVTLVVVVFTVVAVIVFVGGATVEDNKITNISSIAWVAGGLLFLLAGIIAIVYFPWFWARGGQTPGMSLFHIKVVRDRDGGRVGWGGAILRWIGLWVAFAVFYLGLIWIFVDHRRRGWQDLVAGTVVIRAP